VAINAEAVGQLLANSALLKGERQLLNRQEEPPAEAGKPGAQEKASPIVNNSKTVETVLLTLLDEQLQASKAALVNPSANPADSDGDASKRVAAKYAADGLIPGDDSLPPESAIPRDQVRMREMSSVVSADMQTFVQRFAAFAAFQVGAAANDAARDASRRSGADGLFGFNRVFSVRFVSLAAVLLWLIALAIQWVER
jgi:hypothetical protein